MPMKYEDYHGKPEKIKERVSRDKARRALKRDGKARKDGREVDHKDGNPLNNSPSNLRVIARGKNRKKQ